MIDVALGVTVGGALGWLCFVILKRCFNYAAREIAKVVKSPAIYILLATVIAVVPAVSVLLLTLPMQYFIIAWDRFLVGWAVGLLIGMSLSGVGCKEQRRNVG